MMPRRSDRERGSATLWAVLAVSGALMVMGLVVDGGAQMRAVQRADQVAREAARAAGQAITGDPVLGRPGLVDVSEGRRAATAYLKAAEVDGAVDVNGTQITVTTHIRYTPVMLSAFGINGVTVTGSADAQTVQVYQGQEK